MNGSFACTRLGWIVAATLLSGCMNMTGLGGGSRYACRAPEGVTCDSVSGTYANALANRLPGRQDAGAEKIGLPPPASTMAPAPAMAQRVPAAPSAAPSASPLRSSARILRLWFKAWEDADGDLYDQGHVYVQVDGGQWMIEHAQRQVREAYAPLRPPPRLVGSEGSDRRGARQGQSANAPAGPAAPFPAPGPAGNPSDPPTE